MSVKPCRWEEVCKPKDDDVAGVRGMEVYAEMRTALTPRGPTEYSPGEPGPFTGSVVSDMSLSPFEKHLSSLCNLAAQRLVWAGWDRSLFLQSALFLP